MDAPSWKDLTAIYAAIVATYAAVVSSGVALMNYLKYRRDVKDKLYVEFVIETRYHVIPGVHVGPPYRVAVIRVANHSVGTKYIKQPYFGIDSTKQWFVAITLVNPVQYPVKMEAGETWSLDLEYNEFISELRKKKPKKLRVFVPDTLGKSFKSDWVKVKDL